MNIEKIIEYKKILEYIEKHNLLKQYKKAKNFLLIWENSLVEFKLRQPKNKWIFQFKINKKFRAYWYFEENTFIIAKISDHQE